MTTLLGVFKRGTRRFCLMSVLIASVFDAVLCGGDCGISDGTVPLASPKRRITCHEAEQDCIGRLTCGMAFHGHRLDCKRELAGRTPGRCSIHCRQSLISLASTEEGYTYVGCDCGTDDFCRALLSRLAPCWWQRPCPTNNTNLQIRGGPAIIQTSPASSSVQSSMRPQCSRITRECVLDPVCSVAWDYYRRFLPRGA
ncbi:hypothetical protein HPB48_011777 [Haemaphysalis longicornis]|uniref:Secreted protein n=1 Tax=Haemaphysalis longicornis TaxID=44386 RepID=A0A9J6GLP6_HAELO|nr:hypothetical protein HPB48_011777 [Haemaphysalis longicornis]